MQGRAHTDVIEYKVLVVVVVFANILPRHIDQEGPICESQTRKQNQEVSLAIAQAQTTQTAGVHISHDEDHGLQNTQMSDKDAVMRGV